MGIARPTLALAAALLAALPVTAAKPDEWVEMRSDHFHVVSNAKPKDIQRLTRKLEEYRYMLTALLGGLRVDSPLPTSVVIFKNEKSFNVYAPRTPQGKTTKLGGYMQPGQERMYLALHLSNFEAEKTAFHEFIHLVLRLNFEHLPVWLDEGLAEFYERAEINGVHFKVGDWNPGWWDLLQRSRLIPLEVLTQVDHQSEYYNKEDKRALFYAQSWLLIHYWVAADEEKRQTQFTRFLQLLRQGVPQAEALRQAFGADFREMNKQLGDYLARPVLYRYAGKLDRVPPVTFSEPRPLSPAALLYRCGHSSEPNEPRS